MCGDYRRPGGPGGLLRSGGAHGSAADERARADGGTTDQCTGRDECARADGGATHHRRGVDERVDCQA